jgi:uncharacterized membrane protein
MENGVQVRQSFTLNLPLDEVFAFWRRLRDFPQFMRHVESVEELDETRSRWVVRGPAGQKATWNAEIVEEDPGRVLAWRTVGDPDVRHGGRVEFRPATGGRGTVVSVRMAYEPPAGAAGRAVIALLGEDPETRIREDLRRFKQLAEAGEVPTTHGQPSGRADEDEIALRQPKPSKRRAGRRGVSPEVTP